VDKKSKSLKKILSFWGYESVGFSVLRPTDFTSTKILLRPKLYFDLYFSTNNKSRFEKRSKYRGRSKDGEVERSKYRKGRRYENGRSTEMIELMRTQLWTTQILGNNPNFAKNPMSSRLNSAEKLWSETRTASLSTCL